MTTHHTIHVVQTRLGKDDVTMYLTKEGGSFTMPEDGKATFVMTVDRSAATLSPDVVSIACKAFADCYRQEYEKYDHLQGRVFSLTRVRIKETT